MIEVVVKDKETGEEVKRFDCTGVWMCMFNEEANKENKLPSSRAFLGGTVHIRNVADIGLQVRDLVGKRTRDPDFAKVLFMQGYTGKAAEDERGTDDATSN